MNKFDILKYKIIFTLPEKIEEPFSWIDHIPFAFFLVDILRPELLVELGVYSGNSYNAFCQAVKAVNGDTKCYGIDNWLGDKHVGHLDESVYQDLLAYQQNKYKNFSYLLRMTFDEGLNYFSDNTIDLLHIDGLHTYKAVKHDFDAWLPKMSDKGVIVLHDTCVREHDFGVWKLWKEISGQFPSYEFTDGHGLGIVAVGKNINNEFLAFLDNARKNNYYQIIFANLGNKIALIEQTKNLNKELNLKNKELNIHTPVSIAQLYIDLGDGYSGTNLLNKEINSDETRIEYDLNDFIDIKGLRFDPLNDYCKIIIRNISLICGNNKHKKIKYKTNAWAENENEYDFDTNDPQIYLELDNISAIKKIIIELEYLSVGIDSVAQMLEKKNLEISIKNQELKAIDNALSHKNNELQQKNAKNIESEKLIFQQKIIIQQYEELQKQKHDVILRLESENGKNERFIQKLEKSIAGFDNLMAQKNNQLDEIKSELVKFSKQLNKSDAVIEQLTRSLSWRITKPLRLLNKKNLKSELIFIKNRKKIKQSGLFDEAYYLDNNPDVKQSGMNPLKHYLLFGGLEGRNPSPMFDGTFYLSQYSDVKDSELNPLLHYVLYGKNEGRIIYSKKLTARSVTTCEDVKNKSKIKKAISGIKGKLDYYRDMRLIRKSGMFDPEYYLNANPDVKTNCIDPFKHYYLYGWKEGRNPSPDFDNANYLFGNIDVLDSGMNPLFHYIKYGKAEGRSIRYEINPILESQDTFEKADTSNIDLSKCPVKTIAFYLPQFHPIPENDEWWGKGFTEWTNVTKAQPLFEGHYQPHLPLDLGFYDLRNPKTMEQQVEMAKSFGIQGFCFYNYWFDGKRLLEKPLDMFLQHPEWDINFCLCWANENWTRQWDGMNDQVLIAQNHSPEDDIGFIKDITKYIDDPRYITIHGKPLLVIYRPQLFPNIKVSVKRWRKFYKDNYNKELYLTMVQTFGKFDPNEFDFDAAIEFPPHNVSPKKITSDFKLTNFTGKIFDTRSIIKNARNKLKKADYEIFRGVMLNWDNTARKGLMGNIYLHNTPSVYESWLSEAFNDTLKHKTDDSKKLVFINAWNEWAEGTHLEPDQKYGYSYLNATKRSINKVIKNLIVSTGSILFVSHDAHLAGAEMLLLHLLKWFVEHTAYQLKIICIEGGALLEKFQSLGSIIVWQDFITQFPKKADRQEALINFFGQIDLIYGNTVISPSIYDELNFLEVPMITHVHELEKSIKKYGDESTLKKMHKYTNAYIGCSAPVTKNLIDNHYANKKQIRTIYDFIDSYKEPTISISKAKLRKKLHLNKDSFIVFGCGTIYWRKGVDLFIETALKLLKKGRTNFNFYWIGNQNWDARQDKGDYPTWAELEKKMKDKGLNKYITFLGEKTNLREYFSAGDLFYLSSREDPFPLVSLEAAACSLPTICFADAGGMPEFVKNNAGYVVPYEDTAAVADKIAYLIDQPEVLQKLGECAKEKMLARYTVDTAGPQILRYFREVGNIKPLVRVHP